VFYDYPVKLTAEFDGQRYLVVGVESKTPIVLTPKGRRRAKENTLEFDRSEGFYSGAEIELTIEDAGVFNSGIRAIRGPGARYSDPLLLPISINFEITLAGSVAEELYAVIAVYPPNLTQGSIETRLPVILTPAELGMLKEGVPTRLSRSGAILGERTAHNTFGLAMAVFVDGVPMRGLPPQSSAFFRSLERRRFQDVLDRYLENGSASEETLPLTPYLRFSLWIPTELKEREGSVEGAVLIQVSKEGIVEQLEFDENFPEDMKPYLAGGLLDWLFLPPLRDGIPHSQSVRVRLRL
jgi:hypothetical protein